MSHGTMKYTLKAHICYFGLMVGLLHYLYSLHADFYTSENITYVAWYSLLFVLTPTRFYTSENIINTET
jgi:hypothetical protein